MIVKNCLSVYAEDITCLFKVKLFHYAVCKWRCKQHLDVLTRRCHRSATTSVDFMTRVRSKRLENNSIKQPVYNFMDDHSIDISDSSNESCERLYTEQRSWKYNKKLSNNTTTLDETFSVVTFNVLSQSLLVAHPELYKGCRKRDLEWPVRFSRLLREFQITQPDVLCLQEVEEEHVKEDFAEQLGRMNYEVVYKKRTGDKVDGCAIFFKRSKFDLIESRTVELFKKDIKLLDRDNIGIIVKLAPKWRPECHVVVATTHLLYNPARTDIRLSQTQYMLAEIERMAFKPDGQTYWPVIYTGDMNFTPDSPVYQLLSNGYLQFNGRIRRSAPYNPNILIPASVGVTDSCQFADDLRERCGNTSRLIFGTGFLHHGFGFESVYKHWKNNRVEASTHQDAWHTVDYIFFSRKNCSLELLSWLELPSDCEAEENLGRLPNELCGSDHLLLHAAFRLSK